MSSRSYYFGASNAVTILGFYAMNINYQVTSLISIVSYITTIVLMNINPMFSALSRDYAFAMFFFTIFISTLSYLDTKA